MVDKNFDFITLMNGDRLIIEKNEYEVISAEDDVENILPEDDVQDIYTKSFIKVKLHKTDSKSLILHMN